MNALPLNTRLRLKHQHECLDGLIGRASFDQLHATAGNGWSLFQHLAHLGRYQQIFTGRIVKIMESPGTEFQRYIADNDPDFKRWCMFTSEKLLATLQSDRKNMHDYLADLSEAELNRTGLHPLYGRMNIIQWTEFFLLHEAHHLYTVFTRIQQLPGIR